MKILLVLVALGIAVWFMLKNNSDLKAKVLNLVDVNNDKKVNKEDVKVVVQNVVAEEKKVEEKVKKAVKKIRKPKTTK